MRRRGFLGFLAGGVAAGPSMVKTAAAQLTSAIPPMPLTGSINSGLAQAGMEAGWVTTTARDRAAASLGKLMGVESLEQRLTRKQFSASHDPGYDIAALRSVPDWYKHRMIEARNQERERQRKKTFLQAVVDGVFGDDGERAPYVPE